MDGEKALLFGPYAGFSTKFLKNGSYLDFPMSIEIHNIWPLISAGWKNLPLTKYLVEQVFQSMEDRFALLQNYYPDAKIEDWELVEAGKRVQIIKEDQNEGGGKLQFGTEIVTDETLSLSALLGASPGASTSVSIMLDLLVKCFPKELATTEWQSKLKEMIPSYGESLIENGELLRKIRRNTTKVLKLEE
jgi:malate dehydrogenase (quinone)